MFLIIVVLASATLVDGKNVTNACPKLAVGTTNGATLLWQLLVQGFYILDNVCGEVWQLLECRTETLIDSAECFWAALENLRAIVASYRPFILDYKKKVYDYGVDMVENWDCCVGSESCGESEATDPKVSDKSKFPADVNKILATPSTTSEEISPSPSFSIPPRPTPLPTVPPYSTESPIPKPGTHLGTILIRAKLFGVEFLWFEIDLTNMFY